MNREIGSSFCDVECIPEQNNEFGDMQTAFFSGRTAIYHIIGDIAKKRTVKKALLPSFCCESMIEPFLAHGITLSFYDIVLQNNRLEYIVPEFRDDFEIILYLNYFGVDTGETCKFVSNLREKYAGAVFIEDKTHSLFSENGIEYADYAFSSIRKWTGVADGGIVLKSPDKLIEIDLSENFEYTNTFRQASNLKKMYLATGKGEKQQFLELYNKAEEILDEDYCSYSISDDTLEKIKHLDIDFIRRRRSENFNILCENSDKLKEVGLIPIFDNLQKGEVPLFFPVLAKNSEERNRVRKYFIDNEIYCPVHWPVSGLHELNEKTRSIYEQELSIICDQRYGSKDMLRILDTLKKF